MNKPLSYTTWHTPATDYPRTQQGAFRIVSHRYTKGYYHMSGLLDNALFQAVKPLVITNLQELVGKRWHTWMVDDPPHWEAMKFYAEKSQGKVLTTGLGLGLVIHALATNPKVTGVTVVEQSQDVIDLMQGLVPPCTIIRDDFYEYMAATEGQYDTWIIDLWVTHNLDSKMAAYREALRTAFMVHTKWPNAKLFFHGFPSLCDEVWPMSASTRKALTFLAEIE